MTTSLAAPKAETYAAPGRYYIASPGTSRTIVKNFTAPMTPRYYTGGAGGFRSYSPGQQATLRGAGQTAGIIGQSLARSAMSAAFPAATSSMSTGITNALGLTQNAWTTSASINTLYPTTVPTQLGATLTKAMPYVAAAVSFFTTQGSFGRKAANAAASGVSAYLMAAPDPTGISKAIAVAIMGIQMAIGMKGGKGPRNLPLSGRSLPQNAPQLLKEFGGLEQGPSTLRRYRYFNQQFAQDTAPLNQAHSLVSTRLKSLSRIFPSMRAVSDELDRGRATALSGSGSPGEAYGKLQGYTNALTKAEIFIENLFADKPVQGYIKRKTNMPFEEFEKGFKFSTDVWLADNLRIPRIETGRKDALTEANRLRPTGPGRYGYVDGSQYQTTIYQQQSPIQQATAGYTGLQGGYQSMPGGGYGIITKPAQYAGQYIGGTQAQASTYRPPEYGSRLTTAEYNARYGPILSAAEASAKAQKDVTAPFDKQIKEYKDFMATTPQFGSYTHFRPFEPNWTPGMPQLGLPADAPGPDLDSLKPVLNIQDGQFAGMGGGSGYPLTRFGMGMVPRMSQGKMARQA